MGRNKYPEQTLEKIIETSTQLFIEKGYEQTSIQDILDALSLSKGGLYHHFKSKEEILEVVMHKRAQYISEALNEIILNTKAKNAKEKLKKILHYLSADTETHLLDTVLTSQVKNPYFVVNGLQTCVKQDAPIIRKLIESGIEDGSLQITQPELCAEIFLLLLNFWINPVLFARDLVETRKRLSYLQSLMCLVGMDVIDNDFIDLIINGYDKMGAFSK